jgi:hypothetical protein
MSDLSRPRCDALKATGINGSDLARGLGPAPTIDLRAASTVVAECSDNIERLTNTPFKIEG